MGEGIGVGFEDAMARVSRDMQNAIPKTLPSVSPTAGYTSGTANSVYSQNGVYPAGTTVTQNISITSPKALSEKEAAREFKNLSRKLVLGI
jgi:hypothetical protein